MLKFAYILFSLLLLLSLKAAWLLFSLDYVSLIALIKSRYPQGFEIEHIQLFFTEEKYTLAKVYSVFLSILFGTLLLSLFIFRKRIAPILIIIDSGLKEIIHKTIVSISTLSTKEKAITVAVFILILLHFLYLLYASPFRVDDICSYIFFAHEGAIASALFYPDVNNHIFYNITASVFDLLALSPEAAMILPSGLSFLILLFFIFIFVKEKLGFNTALIALVICGLLKPSVVYATQGRGYMLMSLFAILFTISVYQYVNGVKKKIYLLLIITAGALGTYTLPSFVLVLVPVSLYGIWILCFEKPFNFSYLKYFLISLAICGFVIAMLYIPLILMNGMERLNNPWVQSKGFSYFFSILPASIAESIDYLFGVSGKGYILAIFLFIAGFFVWKKESNTDAKKWLVFFLFLIISTFLFIALRTSFPPYRTWTYLSYILNISLAIVTGYFIRLISSKTLQYCVIGSILILCLLPHLNDSYIPDRTFFVKASQVSNSISSQKPSAILVDRKDILFYYLRFESIKQDAAFTVDEKVSPKKEYSIVVQYQPVFPVQLDSLRYEYQFGWEDCRVYRLRNAK